MIGPHAVRGAPPTTKTTSMARHDGPDHLGLRCNALNEHQMGLNTSDCDAMRSTSIKWPLSPRTVMQCDPCALNGPKHLGLCVAAQSAKKLLVQPYPSMVSHFPAEMVWCPDNTTDCIQSPYEAIAAINSQSAAGGSSGWTKTAPGCGVFGNSQNGFAVALALAKVCLCLCVCCVLSPCAALYLCITVSLCVWFSASAAACLLLRSLGGGPHRPRARDFGLRAGLARCDRGLLQAQGESYGSQPHSLWRIPTAAVS